MPTAGESKSAQLKSSGPCEKPALPKASTAPHASSSPTIDAFIPTLNTVRIRCLNNRLYGSRLLKLTCLGCQQGADPEDRPGPHASARILKNYNVPEVQEACRYKRDVAQIVSRTVEKVQVYLLADIKRPIQIFGYKAGI